MAPTMIATVETIAGPSAQLLREAGCEVLALPGEQGRPSIDALLAELGPVVDHVEVDAGILVQVDGRMPSSMPLP